MGWLVGGASNTGGEALKSFFSAAELAELSKEVDTAVASPLEYYPLPAGTTGERFPVSDPHKEPVVSPRPDSDVQFLHGTTPKFFVQYS